MEMGLGVKRSMLSHDDKISYSNHSSRPKETPGIAGAVRSYDQAFANIIHAAASNDGMGSNRYIVANNYAAL
jgi:hypothetical protein